LAKSGRPAWQDQLFITLADSASDATDFFQILTRRAFEVGIQVTHFDLYAVQKPQLCSKPLIS
jgi:K+ transporter